MRQWAQERGVDLADCWAYADSVSDLPMLAAVGHPVAVNPDEALRKVAKERDFAIADWDLPYGVGLKFPVHDERERLRGGSGSADPTKSAGRRRHWRPHGISGITKATTTLGARCTAARRRHEGGTATRPSR